MTSAQTLTEALGGRWHGGYGAAPCPVCQPERRRGQDALTLARGRDGRLLAHCKRGGCDFRDILSAAGIAPGLTGTTDLAELARLRREAEADAARRAAQAWGLWRDAAPIAGTPAETYLRGRGITCALPPSLRYHADAWHLTARKLPAMIAWVEGTVDRTANLADPRAGAPARIGPQTSASAVHRTYLRSGGGGKAEVEPTKAMLGACAGGAVRLAEGGQRLVVAEGIETALSLASGLLDGPMTLWAALSTSGMRGLRLPHAPGVLIIASDGDDAGRSAARDLAQRAHGLGWRVEMLPAPEGQDWNDVLTEPVTEGGR